VVWLVELVGPTFEQTWVPVKLPGLGLFHRPELRRPIRLDLYRGTETEARALLDTSRGSLTIHVGWRIT
jgi:hypothetical protein